MQGRTARTKSIDFRKHITSNPLVSHGQPCIKGSRIQVSIILGTLASGASHEDLLEEYPSVTKEDILACLAFAAELADYKIVDLPRS